MNLPVNQAKRNRFSMIICVCVLWLTLPASAAIFFNRRDGKTRPAFDLNYNSLGEMGLRFNGIWREITPNPENFDDRIAEFETEGYYFFETTTAMLRTGQILLRPDLNVIIFYKDKKPIVGRSLTYKGSTNYHSEQGESNFFLRYIREATTGFEDKLVERFNQFPLVDTSDIGYNSLAHQMVFLQKNLQKLVDGPTPEDPKDSDGLFFPDQNRLMPTFSKEEKLLNVNNLLDIVFSELLNSAVDKQFAAPEEPNRYNPLDPLSVESVLAEIKDAAVKDPQTMPLLKEIYANLVYFTIKCVRFYFFDDDGEFLNDLFRGYDPQSSTLETLFDSFTDNVANRFDPGSPGSSIRFVKFEYLKDLYPEMITDDVDTGADDEDEALEESESLTNNLHFLFNFYVQIYKKQAQSIKTYVSKHAGLVDWFAKNYKEPVTRLLGFAESHFANRIFALIFPSIRKKFYELDCIKQQKIKNLQKGGKNLYVLRKYLRLLGNVDYDPALDLKDLTYVELKTFSENYRRLI